MVEGDALRKYFLNRHAPRGPLEPGADGVSRVLKLSGHRVTVLGIV